MTHVIALVHLKGEEDEVFRKSSHVQNTLINKYLIYMNKTLILREWLKQKDSH